MTGLESIPFVCEECRGQFDVLSGGICRACRRLLCGRHFPFAERCPLWRRSALRPPGRPLCGSCAVVVTNRDHR